MRTDKPQPSAMPTPMPAQTPATSSVGVISIVVGSLSAISNAMGVVGAVVLILLPRLMAAATTTAVPATAPASAPATAPIAGTAPAPPPPGFPTGMFEPGPQILNALASLLGVLAAALLLAAGIQLLRDRPIARRLHWWFVGLKIPLIALVAVATAWMYSSWWGAGLAGTGAASAWFTVIPVILSVLVSLAYPVALCIVLPMRRTKEYFNELQMC